MGEGRTVLFLHGYLSNKECFAAQTRFLSQFCRTVAVDLPGFGEAGEPPFGYSLDDYCGYVAEIIDTICGGRADIVAHSFGGRIALKLAATRPEAVGKMLLVGCAGIKPRRKPQYYIKTGIYKILKRTSPRLAKRWESRHSSPDYLALSPVMRESFKKIVNEHLDGVLCKIAAPTLLVFGDGDTETPLYMARRLNKGIAGSGLVIMKNCGHFCFVEKPTEFDLIAAEFLLKN